MTFAQKLKANRDKLALLEVIDNQITVSVKVGASTYEATVNYALDRDGEAEIERFNSLSIDGDRKGVTEYNVGLEELPYGVEEALCEAIELKLEEEEAEANKFVDGIDFYDANDPS